MATLTIRLPDDKHERLKAFAQSRGISVNKLVAELSTIALAEFDAFTRFTPQSPYRLGPDSLCWALFGELLPLKGQLRAVYLQASASKSCNNLLSRSIHVHPW